MIETTTHSHSNAGPNDGFDEYVARMGARVAKISEPMFTTNVTGLFDAYLATFPPENRQHHNCQTCRRFFDTYGGLVTIDDCGQTKPVMWNSLEAPDYYRRAVSTVEAAVRRAKVTGVFLSSSKVYGTPETLTPVRWTHYAVKPHASLVYRGRALTAEQTIAQKGQDYQTLSRALAQYDLPVLEQAVTLLKTDALYRSEKVLGAAEWLRELKLACVGQGRPVNLIWRAVAFAPPGFCTPRSGMIGTLLDDLQAGKSIEDVKRSFAAKMNPLAYQRPQAAPAAGTVRQAEKLVTDLGLTASLDRRFARLDEVLPHALWAPNNGMLDAIRSGNKGVFGHLLEPKQRALMEARIPVHMTWAKFARTVLPELRELEVLLEPSGAYIGLLTAMDPSAPPILQWDHEDKRNPVSWYCYSGGNTPRHWNLQSGTHVRVLGITELPCHWDGVRSNHDQRKIFLLEGAKDMRKPTACLFPEILKSELHSVRSVIEAHSKSQPASGTQFQSACGVTLGDGAPLRVRATLPGAITTYILDRLE